MQKAGGLSVARMKASARAAAGKMKSKTHSFASRGGFKVPKIQKFK